MEGSTSEVHLNRDLLSLSIRLTEKLEQIIAQIKSSVEVIQTSLTRLHEEDQERKEGQATTTSDIKDPLEGFIEAITQQTDVIEQILEAGSFSCGYTLLDVVCRYTGKFYPLVEPSQTRHEVPRSSSWLASCVVPPPQGSPLSKGRWRTFVDIRLVRGV